MKNVVLIGMPGAGKSTAGVVLAKTLGMNFIDTDLLIQAQTKQKLQDIIDRQGIERFLQIENEVVRKIDVEDSVIATGGSVVFGEEAMQNLRKKGIILYLQLSAETIARRLGNIRTRGIAMPPGMTVQELFEKRTPLYEKYADMIVPTEGKSLEQTVAFIMQLLEGKE